MFKRFLREEQGQDVIEWGLLAAFLGIGIIAAATVTGIGTAVAGWYSDILTAVNAL